MIPRTLPCFNAPAPDRPPRWKPADFQPHPILMNIRSRRPQPLRLERVEPDPSEAPAMRPVHELSQAMVRHFDNGIRCMEETHLLQRHAIGTLREALRLAREMAGYWVRLCGELRMRSPDAADTAHRVLNCLMGQLKVVQNEADALPGFSEAQGDVRAALAACRHLEVQVRALAGHLASVWPRDGGWERKPPTLGEVLTLMQTRQDPGMVQARLEEGQSPLTIASEPSTATLKQVTVLRQQLARTLGNPDLALPLEQALVLLATPPVPVDCIARGLRCGLGAVDRASKGNRQIRPGPECRQFSTSSSSGTCPRASTRQE